MLTGITAARTTREIVAAAPPRTIVEVQLLLFRRIKDTAIHEAKKTRDGLPTPTALLERAWIEQHSQPGMEGWETSFGNCCRMLREDENEERIKALAEIGRAWRKALGDWGRRRWQEQLEQIERMKAEANPAWARGRAIQNELPLD
jgi:hypothetical protein